MTNYKPYPAYKDSGEAWLREIPKTWELTRLGTRFHERRTKVSDKDYEPLSVTKNGILTQLDTAAKTNDGDNRKQVKSGDFVINSRSDRKGSSGVADKDGSVSLINIVMKPTGIHPTFCNYLLKGNSFIEEFYRNGHGIVADLWTTRYDEMKNIKIGIPSPAEQTAIADFLDDKTAKIDKAIAQKERLIALLKERKQIIIQNAVTKGLDPKVKMKDSGIEWIGEIPEHWEVVKNRTLFLERNQPGKAGLPILSVSIHSGVSDEELSDEENLRGKIRIEDKTSYKLVKTEDVAYNMMRAWQGGIGRVPREGMVSPAYVVIIPSSRINAAYFENQYRLPLFIQEMNRASKGITDFRKRLYWNEFKQLSTLVPPCEEQEKIVASLVKIEAQLSPCIESLKQQIQKLREYRATLIDSAVTGKIDIREHTRNS